jgi:hypothetical protein
LQGPSATSNGRSTTPDEDQVSRLLLSLPEMRHNTGAVGEKLDGLNRATVGGDGRAFGPAIRDRLVFVAAWCNGTRSEVWAGGSQREAATVSAALSEGKAHGAAGRVARQERPRGCPDRRSSCGVPDIVGQPGPAVDAHEGVAWECQPGLAPPCSSEVAPPTGSERNL